MGLFHRHTSDNIPANSLLAPQTGKILALSEVPDPVFSGKVLGDGIAMQPTSQKVVSPVSGTIVQIADTMHAVCIESDDGLEILLHMGLDTVKLGGKGFVCLVKVGQHVKAGEHIMDMDLGFIESQGYKTITPCLITNMDHVKSFNASVGSAEAGKTVVLQYEL